MSSRNREPSVIRAFPWASLDSTTRAEAESLRDAHRWARRYVQFTALKEALGQIVGAKVQAWVTRARPLSKAGPFGEGYAVALSTGESPANRAVARVEAECALATTLVAHAIRRTPPVVVDTTATRPGEMAGALAAVLLSAARRSHASAALRVVWAGNATALDGEVSRPEEDPIAIALTVLVADEAYAARVVLARGVTCSAPPAAWNRAALSGLGSIPLSLPILACAVPIAAADVASLRRGDVVVPGGFPLVRTPGEDWVGPVLLSAPGGAVGIGANLSEGNRLVLRGEGVSLDETEAAMDESDGSPAIVDAVGEIPVVLRVEIGQARMLAREWASLSRGDIVALGQRVGERVILRVGGVVVGRGELVDIEGEVGVRVVERVAEEPAGP